MAQGVSFPQVKACTVCHRLSRWLQRLGEGPPWAAHSYPSLCPQIVRLLNSFPALLSLSSALWALSEPASPRTLFWNALSFCTAYPSVPSFAHSESLHFPPCTNMTQHGCVGASLFGSAHPCYSQISFVLLLFETPLTRHCFSPASPFMSK